MNLEQASISLREHFPAGSVANLRKEEQMLEKFGKVAFTGFGICLLLAIGGIIYWIITKVILSGNQPLAGILIIAFIIFAALALGYVYWNEALKEKRQKLNMPGERELPSPATGQLEEGIFDPVPSVTEHTTSRLTVKK